MHTYPSGNILRSGNAIIAALGIVVIVAGVVIVSSTSATSVLKSQDMQLRQTKAAAAVEAVLSRREILVSQLSSTGKIGVWEGVDPPNYGMDVIGEARVRWKIEPSHSVRDEDLNEASQSIKYLLNPTPVAIGLSPDPREQLNGYTFVYRIAAEAEILGSKEAAPSLAQGARYVALTAQPLFRYVINYLRSGPAGDLEISHNPEVKITGNVNSNGAIYVGSNVMVNDWGSTVGGEGATIIGDADAPVVVNAMDGIFRLSKPTIYGALNLFKMTNGGTPITNPEPYLTWSGSDFPSDLPQALGAATFGERTLNGRFFNPYRITAENSKFVTGGPAVRSINGNPLLGTGAGANDSRDDWRSSSSRKFVALAPQAAPDGFKGYVRTAQTTAVPEIIPEIFRNRALEPQALVYRETDGDPLTDDHDFAIPEFYLPGAPVGSQSTTVNPLAAQNGANGVTGGGGARLVEKPGTYLAYQLGTAAMRRRPDGSGWDITDQQGKSLASTAIAAKARAGLIIRERPVPEVGLWPPNGTAGKFVPFNDPEALPYTPGKHWRPVSMPFTPIDVTENLSAPWGGAWDNGDQNGAAWTNINHDSSDRTRSTAQRSVAYLYGGRMSIVAGAGVPAGRTVDMWANRQKDDPSEAGQSYYSREQLYRDNWRFVHLRNRFGLTDAQITALPKGLRYEYWNDDGRNGGSNAIAEGRTWQAQNHPNQFGGWRLPLQGRPQVQGTVERLDYYNTGPWAPTVSTPPSTLKGTSTLYYSVRWSGFIVPPKNGSYQIGLNVDDGFRVWIDDRLVLERYGYDGNDWWTSGLNFIENKPVKIVIEMWQVDGDHRVTLKWAGPSISAGVIPGDKLRVAPEVGGFDRDKFKSATIRIDPTEITAASSAGLDDRLKTALMIRPEGMEADMLSGRDRYIALGYSPKRGVFLERRMEDSRRHLRTSTSSGFWVGEGSYTLNGGASVATMGSGVLPVPTDRDADVSGDAYKVTRTATITRGTPSAPTASGVQVTNDFWYEDNWISPHQDSVNLGDGKTATVTYGPNKWTGKYKGHQHRWIDASRQYPFKFANAVWPFDIYEDRRPEITLFGATNTQTTVDEFVLLAAGSYATDIGDPTTIYISQGQRFETWGPDAVSPPLAAGEDATNAVWGPFPDGMDGSTFVDRLNGMNWNGRNDWFLGAGWSRPVPPLPLVPAADPTIGSMVLLWDDKPHSFSVHKDSEYRMEVSNNPWTSASGTWFQDPAVGDDLDGYCSAWPEQNRPWLQAWTDIYKLKPAHSRSLGPDLSNVFQPIGAPTTVETNAGVAVGATTGTGPLPTILADDLTGLAAANIADGKAVWLRIQRAGGNLVFEYALASGTTVPTAWSAITPAGSVSITDPVWKSLLIGPAVQTGDKNKPASVVIGSMSIATDEAADFGNGDGVIDATDWDGTASGLAGLGTPISRYLASQYQVWFGRQDITEDFFSWGDQVGGRPIAQEEWFYNPREFWSQNDQWLYWDPASALSTTEPWGASAGASRWDPLTGWLVKGSKDGGTNPWDDITNRVLLSKTTILSLDLERLWLYLKSRTFSQAATTVMSGAALPVVPVGTPSLAEQFNGLIYVARTNRFPFNSNQPLTDNAADPDAVPDVSGNLATQGWQGDPTKIGGANPWSYQVPGNNSAAEDRSFPSSFTANPSNPVAASNNSDATLDAKAGWNTQTWISQDGIPKLNPYEQATIYPIRPQQFHEGVLIRNGSKIDWGVDTGSHFGDGGTSIVTPNALYVQGDFNTSMTSVTMADNSTQMKHTPCAVMADSVILLSNNFKVRSAAVNQLSVSQTTVNGGGVLARPLDQVATDTSYFMGIVTHNQPTTQARVLEGQSSPFIDTMLLMEDWSGRTLSYTGSLVVLDTKRYTDAFLLDGKKSAGRSPFGYLDWVATVGHERSGPGLTAPSNWKGQVPQVYNAPKRKFDFQSDFLTAEGTPPFAPFGMTSRGVGGWIRVVQ